VTRLALTDLTIQRLKPTDRQVTYWDSLPGFGLRVSKHTKTFVVMKGKERKLVTLGRYPDLALKRARTLAILEMGKDTGKGSTTFLEAVLSFTGASRASTKPATHREYVRYLDFFGFDCELGEISMSQIREKLKLLDGKPTAQNYAFATMRVFLNWCLREGLLDTHPMIRVQLPNKPKSRDRVLSDEELKAIWHASDYKPFGHIIRVLMLTGQRKMEIARLTQVTDVLTFADTKTNNPHTIPLTPLVKEHLPILFMNGWSKAKASLDDSSGVTDWTIHDLRRTFSTNCAKLGIPIHVTEKILNHRSGSVSGIVRTYNRYSYQKEMLEALLTHETFIRTIVGARV